MSEADEARQWFEARQAAGYRPSPIKNNTRPRVAKVKPVVTTGQNDDSGYEVPRWVPASLWDDYIKIADALGEEYAATVVRKLKAAALASPQERDGR